MKTKFVSLPNGRLNTIDQGNGQVILFVHGFPLDHTMWQFQTSEFATRYRVVCPDLAGFGASPTPDCPMSMNGFAGDLADLLDALQITQPVVYCGLSMGGYIGWQFWKNHANRISHLVACDTRAGDDSAEVKRARKIAANGVCSQSVADAMAIKLFHQTGDPALANAIQPMHQVMAQTRPESIAGAQLAMAARPDVSSWLSEISIPTLFAVGEHDTITPPSEMRANANLVPHAEFIEIGDAGHMAPWENPNEFNRRLMQFLEQHP